MNELLKFIILHFSFLYNDYDARFVDSKVDRSNALLTMELGELKLRFVRDKSQVFLDFQGRSGTDQNNWFSYDVVQQHITKVVLDDACVDGKKAKVLQQHIGEIVAMFSGDELNNTEAALRQLERERAKRMFG